MRYLRLLSALVVLLAIAHASPAQEAAGAPAEDASTSPPATEADLAYRDLYDDFRIIQRSLQNSRGLLDEDRPVVEAFLQRVEAFTAQWPDDAKGVAMELQLCLWLERSDRLGPLFDRLLEIDPGNENLTREWLRQKRADAPADLEGLAAAYATATQRFPDAIDFRLDWAKRLRALARYEEAVDALTAVELDPDQQADAVLDLAECLFSLHRFEEAMTRLISIPEPALTRSRYLRDQVDRLRPVYAQYIELWQEEQELRQAEDAAGDLPRVEIHTSRGRIVVALFENEAPNTVANFISLVETGFYNGTRFHRWEPDFMIQGGDPNSRPGAEGVPGQGNPGYFIADEHTRPDHRKHFRDSIAMAKGLPPDTGGCQFYLTFRPTHHLNGQHTVFGCVVEGLNVAHALKQDDEITTMVVLFKRDHPYEPETLPLETEPAAADPTAPPADSGQSGGAPPDPTDPTSSGGDDEG